MTSRKETRLEALKAALQETPVLHIRTAATRLHVSEMTVRRDISDNAHLFGFFGGHITLKSGEGGYDLARATDRASAAKRTAAMHALPLIRPDETVFFDCGSTIPFLIDALPEHLPLTVVCYALNTAERLARKPNIRMVLLGGLYHPASASFSGPQAMAVLGSLRINRAFLSAAGISASQGATCAHFHEAEIKQQVVAMAGHSALVADSSKIGQVKAAYFAPFSAFDAIFTENGRLDATNL